MVKTRSDKLFNRELGPEDYRIKGSYEFMENLYHRGIDIYIASGTDDVDVQREVQSIGIKQFVKHVAGAPPLKVDCSKKAVIENLMEDQGLKGNELLLVGDGKVEISLGVDAGAITLGVATDEINRCGVNYLKRDKLIKAGAHAIVGDFTHYSKIYKWLGL
jgi:phosphoglycolate phosphatase-like HAD superfamily hydrolase